jgi:hypothetical protein
MPLPMPQQIPQFVYGMASRERPVEGCNAALPTPAVAQGYCAPPQIYPQQAPIPAMCPSAMPMISPYASPVAAHCYPAPPVIQSPFPQIGPSYVMDSRPLSRAELLRGALFHLEAAGAEDLAKQVRIEVATEEKRELAEELSRKEVELQALKADVDRLRTQVAEPAAPAAVEPANEPTTEPKKSSPQVKVSVKVLEIDVAKMKALGLSLPTSAMQPTPMQMYRVTGPMTAEAMAKIEASQAQPKPEGLAAWMNRKLSKEVSVGPAPGLCVLDSGDALDKFLLALGEAKAVTVLAEPSLVVESGRRARFCCNGDGTHTHRHANDETCDLCLDGGIDLDLVATKIAENQVETEILLRHREATVVPANTTGLEGPLPPGIRTAELSTGFTSKSGQTFLAVLPRPARCKAAFDSDKADADKAEASDSGEAAKPTAKEVMCVVLVTPALACCQSACCQSACCSSACCSSACCTKQPCACPKCAACYQTTSPDGIRLRTMREPFLKDVQVDEDATKTMAA